MQIETVNRLKIFDFDIGFTIQCGQDKINTYFVTVSAKSKGS